FGIADTFVSVDGGRATTNFGQFRPPNAGQVQTSLLGQTVINNPYSDATTFVTTDGQGDLTFPGGFFQGNSVQTITSNSSAIQRFPASGVTQIPGNPVTFTGRAVPVGSDPFAAGITNITQGTPTTITTTITDVTTTDAFGNTVTRPTTTSTTAVGTPPSATNGLPSLFQFPRQFLLSLQAQVQSGNAKVLTDPTLIVQEGSQSQVNLTQQVFSGFTEQRRTEGNLTTTSILPGAPIDVGVILNIFVDQIDDNGFITLSVAPEVSAPGQSITDPSRNNLIVQQLVNRRRLETGNIRLRDGQTLILTGVIQESDRVITTKTPILGDLPLIGALFRSTSRENSRSEVVVMITPQIMDDSQQSGAGYNYTPSPDVREMLERGRGSR
ncbi:MAG: type II and III secretion system protein, partial [Leptolyngbyaceae cyanobacterium bins.59]|nr:type II and III secretion system protein [Leptolyngbyaceae cyanobacterium bins.59]